MPESGPGPSCGRVLAPRARGPSVSIAQVDLEELGALGSYFDGRCRLTPPAWNCRRTSKSVASMKVSSMIAPRWSRPSNASRVRVRPLSYFRFQMCLMESLYAFVEFGKALGRNAVRIEPKLTRAQLEMSPIGNERMCTYFGTHRRLTQKCLKGDLNVTFERFPLFDMWYMYMYTYTYMYISPFPLVGPPFCGSPFPGRRIGRLRPRARTVIIAVSINSC